MCTLIQNEQSEFYSIYFCWKCLVVCTSPVSLSWILYHINSHWNPDETALCMFTEWQKTELLLFRW